VLRMVTVRHAPASAGRVRRQLGADLAGAGVPAAVISDATLVVSELVGNAVRYAAPLPGGVLEVTWALHPDHLRLRVCDGGGVSVPGRRTSAGAGWRSSPHSPGTGGWSCPATAPARRARSGWTCRSGAEAGAGPPGGRPRPLGSSS